jgi:hypothetical protein
VLFRSLPAADRDRGLINTDLSKKLDTAQHSLGIGGMSFTTPGVQLISQVVGP